MYWRLQRPWLSLWESCQPNRLTERVLRLRIGSVYWNAGPSQTAPYGAASSPKGRAKVASLHTICGFLSENGAFFVISTLQSSIFTLFFKPQILDISSPTAAGQVHDAVPCNTMRKALHPPGDGFAANFPKQTVAFLREIRYNDRNMKGGEAPVSFSIR